MKQANKIYSSLSCLDIENLSLSTSEISSQTPNAVPSSPTSVVDMVTTFDEFATRMASSDPQVLMQTSSPPKLAEGILFEENDSDLEMELVDAYSQDPPQLHRVTNQHLLCQRPSDPIAKYLLRQC